VWHLLARLLEKPGEFSDLARVIESAPDAMVVADAKDRIVLVNAETVRLFGYARPDLVGHDVEMLIPERFRERHRAKRAKFHLNGGKRVLGLDADVFGRRKDGTEFPAEVSVAPLVTSGGRLVVSMIRDLTDRRRAQAALRESEARYRTLLDDVLDTSAVGVCILDADRRVVWVNQAFEGQFGLARREILAMSAERLVADLIAPVLEGGDVFRERLLRAYADNAYAESFECHVLAGGTRLERWLDHWSQPIRSGLYVGGRIEHYTDVTDRRDAERKVRRYRHIVSNMQIGLIVYRLEEPDDDRTLRAIVINPEGERLIGIPKGEILGKRIDELFPGLREKGIPQLFAQVIRSGETRDLQQLDYGDARVVKGGWRFKAFPLPESCVGVAFERI